jgi:hypothetical protein
MVAGVLLLALLQVTSQPAPPHAPPRDDQPASKGTGVIRGRVVAADTGLPIRGCHISLVRAFNPEDDAEPTVSGSTDYVPRFVRTNEDGRFQFSGVTQGKYRLSASPHPTNARYVPPFNRLSNPFGKPFDLASGQKLDLPEIRLPRAAVLTGRVLDESGEPVARVGVKAVLRASPNDPGGSWGFPVSTDDNGHFRIFGLQPGEYVVIAEPQDFGDPRRDDALKLLPTYLPSASTLAEAAPIQIRAGQEVGDLEIRLLTGRTFKVSGSVMTSKGLAFSRRLGQVSFSEPVRGGGMNTRGVDLRNDGTFEVDGIRPGTYSIDVGPTSWNPDDDVPADAEYASVPITVGGDDIENLSIVTQPGASVAGRVVFDEQPPSDELLTHYVSAMSAGPRLVMSSGRHARVETGGEFVLSGLHRPVYIRVASPPGYYLASVTFEGEDITDTPTEFKPGTTGRVLVTLSRRGSELSGEIHDSDGQGSCFVIAFGEDRALWTPHATTTKGMNAEEAGKYRLRGLRPGRYLVAAVPVELGLRFLNDATPEEWESIAKHATPVTIGDDERKVLNLKLAEVER